MDQDEIAFRTDHLSAGIERDAARFQLALELARLRPEKPAFAAALDAAVILKLTRQLKALAIAECNYGLTMRQERRRTRLKGEVQQVARWYGLDAHCFGDPRGSVVTLHGPIAKNGFGDGFNVPS